MKQIVLTDLNYIHLMMMKINDKHISGVKYYMNKLNKKYQSAKKKIDNIIIFIYILSFIFQNNQKYIKLIKNSKLLLNFN